MPQTRLDSFQARRSFTVSGRTYKYSSLPDFAKKAGKDLSHLPFSIRILLENLLRLEDGFAVKKEDVLKVADWDAKAKPDQEIQFMPSRILLQDFTGVPAVADLAAMRGAIQKLGGNPDKINPLRPADLVVDHSVQVDHFGTADAWKKNTDLEYERNLERYQFLKWAQGAIRNFSVVPPETGIVHQVNLEFLASLAITSKDGNDIEVYPDSLVGTDSHTTMINGLGVVGWGVGGIEAEAAMLGQPITMLIPQVVGFELKGKLKPHVTATDLVLHITQMLRKLGVVEKFVEFYGSGLAHLTLMDRATIANMAPEYGATIGIFPVDARTIDYLKLTNRAEQAELSEAYYKAQGLWRDSSTPDPIFSDGLSLDLSTVEPSLAGPSRPQDRVPLPLVASTFTEQLPALSGLKPGEAPSKTGANIGAGSKAFTLTNGAVVIAAITSCTNTSNASGILTAGLLAKKAMERGLFPKPWVKTSLAPGSKTVTDYLRSAGLLEPLEKQGFHLVGYGCTTCIGNAGPLPDAIDSAITDHKLIVASVLSGNRNFEGRIHPKVRANFLASPALVVAYAIAGNVNVNLTTEPLGTDKNGKPVMLHDLWPTSDEVAVLVQKHVTSGLFKSSYSHVFEGDALWKNIKAPAGELYQWNAKSTYLQEPPFFDRIQMAPAPIRDIHGARALAKFGDSITTDHISPAGGISPMSPAGLYLLGKGVKKEEFNSYGARRGNHEVMMRGTFANVRIKNQLVPGTEGGLTVHFPTSKQMPIYDASMLYQAESIPLIVLAGKEYGTGSSRDWAAKGTLLLGVRAVIAESFERIHRSNLVGMGVLPLQFKKGETALSLGLTGKETFEILGLGVITQGQEITVSAKNEAGHELKFKVLLRIDTPNELEYYNHGGILPFVLRQLAKG